MKKKKILVLSDHPLSPSGVGTQTKYMIEALLKTGRYQFICLGGAIKHSDYTPIKVDHWGEDWQINVKGKTMWLLNTVNKVQEPVLMLDSDMMVIKDLHE